jgi:staphylococcal nuclease domain-containing protein 1
LVDIISGDTVKLILENKEEIVSLSNVRSRCDDKDASIVNHFNLEAKEFLRKKLVGNKKIMVKIDYRRTLEKTKGDKKIEEERRYVTILVNNKSIAVELVAAGLATVQKRQDQEKSESYDNLLRADAEARKTNKGMHGQINKKKGFRSNDELILKENEKNPTKIIADASKIALTNKDKKIKAVVVRVFNGARFKLYLPDENVTVIFSLDGVSAPSFGKAPKPFSKESLLFSNENLYLRDVNIIVDRIDSVKGLTFIGTLFLNDKDYAIDLLNEGLGTMTKSAAKLKSYTAYQKAEIASRTAKKNIFSIEQEERKPQVTNSKNAVVQGNPQVFQVRVTEIADASHLYLQTPDSAEFLGKVDAEMKLLNLDESQPDESFKPQVKEYVLAKFSEDKNWYRGQVLSIEKSTYTVFYIDFGNKEKVKVTSLRKLAPDSELAKIKPQAKEAFLAYVHFHHTNYKSESLSLVKDFCQGEDLVARHEYSLGKNIYVSLFDSKGKYNLNADLIVNGFAFVTSNYLLTEGPTKELFAKQIEELKKKEQEARQEKSGLWQDGDVYGSDEE